MVTNHCRHIKEDGFYCQAPPLHARDYCRFHLRALGRRMRMARALARREPYHLVLPLLEDINAVQVARMQVLDALAAGLLDQKLGGLFLYGLQQASTDLRSLHAAPSLMVPAGEASAEEGRAAEYPGFEEEFDLPKDLDLTKPPEVVFPAAAGPAVVEAQPSQYRSDPWHRVNREDIELEEILVTQGEEAYKKRGSELDAKAWKRIERDRRQLAEARQIMEAARRNGMQWTSGKLKDHYDKLWAEAAAKEKADKEELAAELAAARAQAQAEAQAKKSPESVSADEQDINGESPKTGS